MPLPKVQIIHPINGGDPCGINYDIFGGMGTTFGPVLGAIILKIIEEVLRINFVYGHMIVYGIILVVVNPISTQGTLMRSWPKGI